MFEYTVSDYRWGDNVVWFVIRWPGYQVVMATDSRGAANFVKMAMEDRPPTKSDLLPGNYTVVANHDYWDIVRTNGTVLGTCRDQDDANFIASLYNSALS